MSARKRAIRSWDDVCAFLEGTFPETAQDAPGGREVVRVRKAVVAFPARNERSRPAGSDDDEEFVIVRVDLSERDALIQRDPETFIVTEHYVTYPGVIVRLRTVDQEQLRELLTEAWRLVAPKKLAREMDERATG